MCLPGIGGRAGAEAINPDSGRRSIAWEPDQGSALSPQPWQALLSWTPLSSEMQIRRAALRVGCEMQHLSKDVAPVVGGAVHQHCWGPLPGVPLFSLHSALV